MAGDGEQMRMWGGWKGLPLPGSHWPGMTTFSPEAPSPSSSIRPALHSPQPSLHLRSPPSPALQPSSSSQQEPELAALAFRIRRREDSLFSVLPFVSFFPSPPIIAPSHGCRLGASRLRRFCLSPLLLRPSLLFLNLPPFHVGWLHLSPACCFFPPRGPLQWSRPC